MAKTGKQVRAKSGKTTIEYYDDAGNVTSTREGGGRPWRNNNPGNLVGGKGAIGRDDGGFAIFPDWESGVSAQRDQIKNGTYLKGKTIDKMLDRYTDPARDDVAAYKKDIKSMSKLDLGKKAEELTDEEFSRLVYAIQRREGAIDKTGAPLKVGNLTPGLSTLRPEPRPQPAGQPGPVPEPPQPSELQPQPAPMQEQKQSEAATDPKVSAMLDMAGTPVANPGRAALLKPVDKLTRSEMTDMIHSAQGDYRGHRAGDPLKAHTYEKVQDWHVAMYGDGPQRNDGGKPIEPTLIRPLPEQPAPHVTPQGEDLWQATARIGRQVAAAAGTEGADKAVFGLQRGLNILNAANPLPDRSSAYGPYTKSGPVEEDGRYGPQTDFALKHATARLGAPKVGEAFALGRFNAFARDAQKKGNVDGLENATHAAFGPLFRDGDHGPKVEGGVLQETLNDIGPRHFDDWQKLKVDDWVGPKTTAAFGRVLAAEDADEVTRRFGRGLGLM